MQLAATRRLYSRAVYPVVVGLMSVVVLLGFWPYYRGILLGSTNTHWLIHIHAAVFSVWMVLLAFQVGFVFRRKVKLHKQLGRVGIYYGAFLLLLGVAVTFTAVSQNLANGRASVDEMAGFLVLPIGDLLLFAGFFSAGIYFRRRPEIHKRLMILASIALLFPAAARFAGDISIPALLAIWLFPLGVIIMHEAYTLRRIDRVYIAGIAVLLVAFARVALMENQYWLAVGRWLLQLIP